MSTARDTGLLVTGGASLDRGGTRSATLAVVSGTGGPSGGRVVRTPSPTHWTSVLAVASGGFAGGLARYGVGLAWATREGAFPWPTLVVNVSGAFLLAVVLVLVLEVLPPTRYVRLALGSGFCGAYTTFGSVTTSADLFVARGQAGTAVLYLVGSVAAGLVATWLGVVVARVVPVVRRTAPREPV